MTVSFQSAGAIVSSASAITLTPVLPAANAGDGLFVLMSINNGAVITGPGGWNKRFETGTTFTGALFGKVATGSDANPAFSWTGATACAAMAIRFIGTANPPWGATVGRSTGTVNPHTSVAFTSTANNSLAFAFDCQSSATAQGSTPAGWTAAFAVGDATSAMAFAGWSLLLPLSGTSSGAISQNEASVLWLQTQIEMLEDPLSAQICL